MTLQEAKEEIPTIQSFLQMACGCCNSEDYCPSYCDTLKKAQRMNFEDIQKAYARHDGEIWKVIRYIKGKTGV